MSLTIPAPGDAPAPRYPEGVLTALGDGSLFGETFGEGPLRVLWLHGWARRGADFAPAARVLAARGISSIALDLPGFGSSAPPPVAGGARYYADLIAPAVAGLGDDVVLVGHSFGGTVATVLAARDARYHGVVLTGAPVLRAGSGRAPWRYRLVRAAARRHLVSQARLEAARQRYGSTDYRRASGIMRDILVATVNESFEDELARQHCPVHFLWGQDDAEVPLRVAERARSLVTAPTTLEVLAHVGHLVPTEAPEALAHAVLEALS